MSEEQDLKSNYSADNIQVLEGLEAVRKRPSMYIGDTGVKGLHHLVYEVVDNSIDEALAGHADTIDVRILEGNSIRVEDNGRGIPTGINKKENKSALEIVMTVLHAGGKFDKDTYKVSGGLHGVGVSCVNALSTHLKAEVHREGKIWMQEYNIGKPLYDVKETGVTDKRGTIVTFSPDATIFTQTTEYKYDTLAGRLRELAFLNKGITLTLTDEREVLEDGSFLSEVFHSEGGLREFVKFLDGTRASFLPDPVYIEGIKNGIPVELAFQYNDSSS
ncbi:MAG: ATP-binding protein, partial [Pedobacter agri]